MQAFAQFFMALEVHTYRQREHGERALLIYQARVRREWHDQMKLDKGFNIAIINDDLLQGIYRELIDKLQINVINEVSTL